MFARKEVITSLFTHIHTIISIYPGVDKTESHAERFIFTGSIIEQTRATLSILKKKLLLFLIKKVIALIKQSILYEL